MIVIIFFVRQQLRQLELSDLVPQTPVQLSRQQDRGIRGSLFSEIMIPSETLLKDAVVDSSEIRALDIEQEEFAKKVPNGHYMVTGIPGTQNVDDISIRIWFILMKIIRF